MSRPLPYLRFMTASLAIALLSACGGGNDDQGEQTVAMRDMEVVDGTASDAMTDLDGVQTGSIAVPPVANGATAAKSATETDISAGPDKKTNEDVTAD
ncbi:hypothetical protein [Rhizorhapis sp. SPR117]|uniref:hypothetical protein n=1 Tax=Rhizorhapis sp. SPR117 TaxID=2912611 RepID=UPI001F167191|nr:hypothetical protein [Rhizorhapis sp. SPR117]